MKNKFFVILAFIGVSMFALWEKSPEIKNPKTLDVADVISKKPVLVRIDECHYADVWGDKVQEKEYYFLTKDGLIPAQSQIPIEDYCDTLYEHQLLVWDVGKAKGTVYHTKRTLSYKKEIVIY